MHTPIDTLVVGDEFIPADSYVDAFSDATNLVRVRTVRWGGTKARQHEQQQTMEHSGANAIPAPTELLDAVPGAQALCLHFAPVGEQLLAAATDLKLVAVARAGLENIDVAAATRRGIGVVPAYGRNAGAVAELQLALMLAEARNVARADASVKSGGWRKEFPGARIEVAGRTVGMVGFGHVGRVFTRRLSGFGCRMVAYDPYVADEVLAEHGVERADTVDQVLAEGDFVLVQARHSTETERMIGARQLRLMRPTAYFINVSRSRLVDEAALLDVLREGAIAGAGLDVYDAEPLPADSPWRTLDNTTLTTHFGGDTEDTNRTSATLVAQAVLELTRTGKVAHAVNAAELGWTS
ncbi:D-3-phosphoglycerate dehydrogenase [Kibdelosporangium banguiense]|uniref:D-3-phosphoglycerate dehydrogenase n=1 Tax=Kibdelosporangium banguiense TaxID=1365924 RepID=A0ABS4TKQ4_9PSEU|nr:NAD(P)-dependent oxidoreductase [Kibdelosporangium banguiense]MBP2324446.1 D-3-phosphoglycerate dehydrogenase [Kibdelosporangium banguiense]